MKNMKTGVSMIIRARNADCLERLLRSFFSANTFTPVELIVVNLGCGDVDGLLSDYAARAVVRQVTGDPRRSFFATGNIGAQKTRFDYLLFFNDRFFYRDDILPEAAGLLDMDPDLAAVCIRRDVEPAQPESPGSPLPEGCVSGAGLAAADSVCLLCRRKDFDRLGGFREGPDDGAFADFCSGVEGDLGKKRVTLQVAGGAARRAPDSINLFFHPDYTASNPYQDLLYRGFPRYIPVSPGGAGPAVSRLRESGAGQATVFHLHWTNPVLRGADSEQKARGRMAGFLSRLDEFLALGGIFVWTVHNVLPHETVYPDLELELCRELSERASLVHVHSPLVPELVAPFYRIAPGKTIVAPHGNYLGVYPVSLDRARARIRFDLPAHAPVFLFLGQIRPYKGLDALRGAFAACRKNFRSAHLIVAGKPKGIEPEDVARFFSDPDHVQVYPDFIPDRDLAMYLQAADYLVIPYRQVLTSGSVLLGQSFSLPPIVPDLGILPDHVADGVSGYLYDPAGPEGLAGAMLRALENHGRHGELAAGALEAARKFSWERSSAVLASGIAREAAARNVWRREEI